MRIAVYQSERDTTPATAEVPWDDLADSLLAVADAPCSIDDCTGKACPSKFGTAWSPVDIDGIRANDNVRSVTAAVFDLDDVDRANDTWIERLNAAEIDAVIHSTHSHRDDRIRLRLTIPVDRPVTPIEWPLFRRAVIETFAIPADPAAKDLSRLFFVPSVPRGAPKIAHRLAGRKRLDVDFFATSTFFHDDAAPPSKKVEIETGRIPDGQRNATLASMAGRMRHHGFSESEILAAITVANDTRCDPPLDADEISKIASSVARYQPTNDVAGIAGVRAAFEAPSSEIATLASEVAAIEKPPIRSYPSGFDQLDAMIHGISTRQLLTVCGPPGAGKTAWVIALARNVAASLPVIYVSTELESDEICARLAAPIIGAPWTEIVRGNVNKGAVADALAGLNVHVIGCDQLPMNGGLQTVQTELERLGNACLIVDYLQDFARGTSDGVRHVVGQFATALRAMAQYYDCPVVAVSSVSRTYYGAAKQETMRNCDDAEVYLAVAKESGDVDYASATILFLDVGNDPTGAGMDLYKPARIAVAKARHGRTGFSGAKFFGASGRWEDAPSMVARMSPGGRKAEADAKIESAAETAILEVVRAHQRSTRNFVRDSLKGEIPEKLVYRTIRKMSARNRIGVVYQDADGKTVRDGLLVTIEYEDRGIDALPPVDPNSPAAAFVK